ncbi:MAG: cupin domain-containing protein [Candidatus Rokuibacteriota bacterium]|nr:MAG: cupin domain-containing protein [Candidatus Rokubacteria bacterium]
MALQVRRVITGHDATGRAIVKIDEVAKNVSSGRPGATACNIWTTEGFPAKNDGAADEGLRNAATTLTNGTIFRVIEFAPGLAARNHRTDSIDYIVVISGEIDMELDGSVVHLKAGDVMVQRGTITASAIVRCGRVDSTDVPLRPPPQDRVGRPTETVRTGRFRCRTRFESESWARRSRKGAAVGERTPTSPR